MRKGGYAAASLPVILREEFRCELILDSSSLALLRMTDGEAVRVAGLPVLQPPPGLRPPGASSFRSCGKKRKKGTPKGRAFYKAAFPFGIPSSEDCLPAAPYAAVRIASLRSARAIAVRRKMSGKGLHLKLACGYAEIIPPVILSEARNLVANLP